MLRAPAGLPVQGKIGRAVVQVVTVAVDCRPSVREQQVHADLIVAVGVAAESVIALPFALSDPLQGLNDVELLRVELRHSALG